MSRFGNLVDLVRWVVLLLAPELAAQLAQCQLRRPRGGPFDWRHQCMGQARSAPHPCSSRPPCRRTNLPPALSQTPPIHLTPAAHHPQTHTQVRMGLLPHATFGVVGVLSGLISISVCSWLATKTTSISVLMVQLRVRGRRGALTSALNKWLGRRLEL